jgi:PAS domain S-box-containing protein
VEESDSAALWRLTMQHSPVGMALVGLDGRILTANRALCDMLGRDAEVLCALGFQEVTHPDDLDEDLELFHATLSGERDSYRVRKRYLHADGHVVWGDLSVALVRRPDGRPVHFVSQVLDVTEQRVTEELLARAHAEAEHERQTLEAIFETVRVGLLLIDSDGRYQRMNPRHRETMHLPFPGGHEGAAGQLGHVYHLDGSRMTREEMPSYRAAQGEEFDDYTYWAGEGPDRAAFSVSARQVRGPTGEVIGAALAYQDVTDLIRALQVKDEFVSSVSHELRTPLTAVLGHLEMLCEDERLPRDVLTRLEVTQRNAARLGTLVSDLLTVAQTQQRALSIAPGPVDVAGLVREAVVTIRPWAEKAGVSVRVEAPDHVAAHLDAGRIRQVVDNLLSNGVKYTAAGGSVSVALSDHGDRVELAVSDTGIGIEPEEIDRVFGRFFRGGEAMEKHIPGTGIGLSIVSAIVAAHHGGITVDSEPGRGSTFRVVLPRTGPAGCGGSA